MTGKKLGSQAADNKNNSKTLEQYTNPSFEEDSVTDNVRLQQTTTGETNAIVDASIANALQDGAIEDVATASASKSHRSNSHRKGHR